MYLDNTLTITNVTVQDIGVYQCIAHRWDPDPDLEEWVSASAVLAMSSDKLIRTRKLDHLSFVIIRDK